MEFCDRLKALMQEKGISQAELARKMKTNRSSVNYWVLGRYKPKSDVVYRLALIFNVSEAWLMGFPDVQRERKDQLDPEAAELVRLFRLLSIRNKTRLLSFAYDLEEEENGKL